MTPPKASVAVNEITLEDYYAASALAGMLAAQTQKVPIEVVGTYAIEIGEWMAAHSRHARKTKGKPSRSRKSIAR
jgi:hypothetical protein